MHYRFKLPDNLTTFRLMAVAAADDRFGAGEAAITTSRRLMARPALPRIVRVGDAFEAGVIVSSRDLGATAADVTLEAQGVALAGPPPPARARAPRAAASRSASRSGPTAAGKASFEFAVSGAGENDRVRVDRGASSFRSISETASVYGETTSAAAVALGDLAERAQGPRGPRSSRRLHGARGPQDQLRPRARLPVRVHRAAHEPHPAAARAARDGERLRRAHARQGRRRRRRRRGDAPHAPARLGRVRVLGGRRRRGAVALGVRDARRRDGGQEGALRAQEPRATAGVDYLRQRARPDDDRRRADAIRERPVEAPGPTGGRARGPHRREARTEAYATPRSSPTCWPRSASRTRGTLNRLFDARADNPLFTQALLASRHGGRAHARRRARRARERDRGARPRRRAGRALRRRGGRARSGPARLALAHDRPRAPRALVAARPAASARVEARAGPARAPRERARGARRRRTSGRCSRSTTTVARRRRRARRSTRASSSAARRARSRRRFSDASDARRAARRRRRACRRRRRPRRSPSRSRARGASSTRPSSRYAPAVLADRGGRPGLLRAEARPRARDPRSSRRRSGSCRGAPDGERAGRGRSSSWT